MDYDTRQMRDLLTDHRRARSAEMLMRQAREELDELVRENKREGTYSVTRALKAIAEGANLEIAAPIEAEASAKIAERLGREPRPGCVFLPVPPMTRDLAVGTSSAGGYLVGTVNAPGGLWVDAVRGASVMLRMGIDVLPAKQHVTIPRYATQSTAYWLTDEQTAITESAGTYGQVAATPKTCAGYTEMSNQLFKQAGPLVDAVVLRELGNTLGGGADAAILQGTGADGQPQGIVGTANVGSVTGTSLAWDDVLEFQSDCAAAVASPSRFGYVSTPTIAKLLATRQRNTGTDAVLWEGSILDGVMAGKPAMSTTNCPTGDIIAGDWSQVLLVDFGGVEIGVNPYGANKAAYQAGIVGLRAFWSVDVAVLRPAAFSVATSVT